MSKFMIAIQIAKLIIFMIFGLKDLVMQAEELVPESGRGKEKFAAVKAAVISVAGVIGVAEDVVKAADNIINERIDKAVAETINI